MLGVTTHMPYGTFLKVGLNEPTGRCCDLRIKRQRHGTKETYSSLFVVSFVLGEQTGVPPSAPEKNLLRFFFRFGYTFRYQCLIYYDFNLLYNQEKELLEATL